MKVRCPSLAPETDNDVTRQRTRVDQLAANGPRAAAQCVADDRVATLIGRDDSHTWKTHSKPVGDEVGSHTLVPASNHMTKIARFNNPVFTGKHY